MAVHALDILPEALSVYDYPYDFFGCTIIFVNVLGHYYKCVDD